MRKLDYYTICYTSTVLRSAAHIPLPTAAKAAALLVAPFKPSIVTGLNLALVEVSPCMLLCFRGGSELAVPVLVVQGTVPQSWVMSLVIGLTSVGGARLIAGQPECMWIQPERSPCVAFLTNHLPCACRDHH
jgi:hypothetical protein